MKASQPDDQDSHKIEFLQIILKRIIASLLILFAIAILTQMGLIIAGLGKAGISIDPIDVFQETGKQIFSYIFDHPKVYYWNRESRYTGDLILKLFGTSFGLLLFSLSVATFLGVTLGVAAAQIKKRFFRPFVILFSILGISTPSFLLAMLFWVLNINIYKWLGIKHSILPLTGFGWDAHIIMPALVLAMRPLAQIMQVTYVNLSDIFNMDYINAAKARGLSNRLQIFRHALPNIYIPIFTTLGSSLKFSLASLPVVESFFYWPGMGRSILQAISLNNPSLVTDLTISLGLIFLIINLVFELLFPIFDPRLRNNSRYDEQVKELSSKESSGNFFQLVNGWMKSIQETFSYHSQDILQTKTRLFKQSTIINYGWPPKYHLPVIGQEEKQENDEIDTHRRQNVLKTILTNMPLVVGGILVLGFIIIAFSGEWFAQANPYETHGIMMIEGVIQAPPFEPSSTFPWGSDIIGRDMRALVLNGAKQTLTLAFLAMLARILVGTLIGTIAGWWESSWFDRFTNALISVWSAFPVTIFAMVLILAMGIEKGIKIFILALCIVGWGEIAQYIRNQVIGQKPALYIEAARSIGAQPHQILSRNVFPHLVPQIVVLAVLEMGGVLMLLAELGFLNIFLGGGFKIEIAELARVATVYFYSDVPEWGAMLANIQEWWRSYPWLAWYPGIFFFLAILAFNLFGEGFRQFIHDSRVNLNRLVNKYTISFAAVSFIAVVFLVRSTSPVEIYKPQSQQFNSQQAYQFARELTSDKYMGRESGTQYAASAAAYIANQMDAIGLFPAGEKDTYIQTIYKNYFHLSAVPEMSVFEQTNKKGRKLLYREDFVEYVGNDPLVGEARSEVIGIILGDNSDKQNILNDRVYKDKILLVNEEDLPLIDIRNASGVLVIDHDPQLMNKKYLYPYYSLGYRNRSFVMMAISEETADYILGLCKSSLDEFRQQKADILPNQIDHTEIGPEIYINIPGSDDNVDETYHNVIGFIPGTGALMGEHSGAGLDDQVIVVSAYYDGLGTDVYGNPYPCANDNASGVATMLEIARVMKQAPYQPKKTVVFVAWSGGERNESLSTTNIMNAKTGFALLNVEAVIELSGVGSGSGDAILIEKGTSYRMTTLIENAASRLGYKTTIRGRGPHFGYEARPSFGGRTALSAYLAWDGADTYAHTMKDTIDKIDPEKLEKVGQTTLLTLSVISRETEY